ncbi:MAG TPA: hypothetical protein DCY64_08765 [Hydrogenophaga sp.]|uniref:HepT-like ribonuclease domain-containing protein n=1 Tax=Hydrogenophaga sp. TaxID=1904254 RepID=UPI0008D17C25|nr:DUF86 domain-containing protein [Hydrogenophaga sp.]OGA77580.1 MAG: hypothetical protein A2X73_10755 [Burkholderiales bacterium GWE1_65_30]OGA94008.1 MAG: hypothetical protein A2X72_01025 [Burkholderiales bacterium GWF1_66_17]OGB37276.1 MAG: hypothetical protein A3B67_12305 [Burkholderiales bacterium RIFCSPHIGHO2_02_FULL_66_10]PKO76808.1 MAG: hypothetical protein CVU21_11245 [Betaproteobacteria bacterium HGW-Betaproteobacteria-15]MDZ4291679.1 DUF86 domain-containing protein [Hydrogenophaga 
MTRSRPLRTADYLRHIAEAIDNIQSYTAGVDAAGFKADRKTQDAVIRNLEIIGEACNNVVKHDPAFAQQHPQVPWGFAYEMRNALAHGYFTVDLDIVWGTVTSDLPGLKAQLASLTR